MKKIISLKDDAESKDGYGSMIVKMTDFSILNKSFTEEHMRQWLNCKTFMKGNILNLVSYFRI